MRGTVQLIPPDKEGKTPVEEGDVIWWIGGIPYKFKVNLWPVLSKEKNIQKLDKKKEKNRKGFMNFARIINFQQLRRIG